MTHEQRLDRLERIAKLFVAAGLRARRNMRELDEKIAILIDLQIQNEERFKDQNSKFSMLFDLQRTNDDQFRNQNDQVSILRDLQRSNEKRFAKLVEFQTDHQRRLAALEKIRKEQNGNN